MGYLMLMEPVSFLVAFGSYSLPSFPISLENKIILYFKFLPKISATVYQVEIKCFKDII